MRPEWLPAELIFNGSNIQLDYDRLHGIYQDDILGAKLKINDIPVIHDNSLDPDFPPYTRGFTHLITREDGSGFRGIDYDRARKLHWIAPIIQNYQDPLVSCFWYEQPKGEVLIVWLEDFDYLLVLKWLTNSKEQKILVTSYSIDHDKKAYYRRLRNRPTSRPL